MRLASSQGEVPGSHLGLRLERGDDVLRLHDVVHLLLALLMLARALALVLGLLELEQRVDLAQVERGAWLGLGVG